MISYPIGTSGQVITFSDEVLKHVLKYRQLRWCAKEAGGQMFARIEGQSIEIVEATGPRPTDKRGRRMYVPDRRAEKAEIAEQHLKGLHFVGDWHTHADDRPRPSGQDLLSMTECVKKSAHHLNGFVLLIVGRVDVPGGFSVSIHDGEEHFILQALASNMVTSATQ